MSKLYTEPLSYRVSCSLKIIQLRVFFPLTVSEAGFSSMLINGASICSLELEKRTAIACTTTAPRVLHSELSVSVTFIWARLPSCWLARRHRAAWNIGGEKAFTSIRKSLTFWSNCKHTIKYVQKISIMNYIIIQRSSWGIFHGDSFIYCKEKDCSLFNG